VPEIDQSRHEVIEKISEILRSGPLRVAVTGGMIGEKAVLEFDQVVIVPREGLRQCLFQLTKSIMDDGDDPVDSEWAEAAGFVFSDENEMYRPVVPGGNLKVVLTGDLTMCEKDTHLSLHWSNWPNKPTHSGSLSIDDNPTRDGLRQLFAALGCPLTI